MGLFSKTILVVEDDPALRKAMVTKLEKEGFKTLETGNGSEVIGIIQTQHPDLILLDLMLPGRDGMNILELMRDEEWGDKTPVIIFTNLSGQGRLRVEAAQLDARYFDKASTDIEEIIQEVKARV